MQSRCWFHHNQSAGLFIASPAVDLVALPGCTPGHFRFESVRLQANFEGILHFVTCDMPNLDDSPMRNFDQRWHSLP